MSLPCRIVFNMYKSNLQGCRYQWVVVRRLHVIKLRLSNLAWSNSIINGVAFNGNTFFYYYLGVVLYNHHHCIGILGTAGRQAPIQDADKKSRSAGMRNKSKSAITYEMMCAYKNTFQMRICMLMYSR